MSLRRRWCVAALALCLVLSQALWLLHRVVHFSFSAHSGAVMQVASAQHAASPWAKSLLPEHQDERSCAQYDQLGHADLALGFEPQPVSFATTSLTQATHLASLMAAQAAGFLARGPPAAV